MNSPLDCSALCFAGRPPATSAPSNRERFLAALRGEPVDRPPLWLMRQAGRSLPEYRALKERHSFIEIVQTPELTAEVTLQPIRRFGFDAAILFSDILIVPEAMGQPYHFCDGGGIKMDFPVRSAQDIRRLEPRRIADRLQYVAEALALIKPSLNGQTALLGFAGSPWTLASFMIEGGSSPGCALAKALYYTEPLLFEELMEKLTLAVTELLQMQIAAGVDAVQIFDSLGGQLAAGSFEEASARWIRQIITSLGGRVPVILFSKGTHGQWPALVQTGADVLGVDWTQSLSQVRALLPGQIGLQGNLDPALLSTHPRAVASEAARILREMEGVPGYIFNLGHGVPPQAKLECIEALVEMVCNAA